MDIQYSPNFLTFVFFVFVFFCFFNSRDSFWTFLLLFVVRFKGVAWKTTEEIKHFIVIWPYIHKANCIVILFWTRDEALRKKNSTQKDKKTKTTKKRWEKNKQKKHLKFLWPASCSSSSILKGFGVILLAPCEVFMCQWCNLLMFVAFLYLYNS